MRDLQIEFSIKDENVIYTMNQSRQTRFSKFRLHQIRIYNLTNSKEKIENDNLSNKSAALIFFPTVMEKMVLFRIKKYQRCFKKSASRSFYWKCSQGLVSFG